MIAAGAMAFSSIFCCDQQPEVAPNKNGKLALRRSWVLGRIFESLPRIFALAGALAILIVGPLISMPSGMEIQGANAGNMTPGLNDGHGDRKRANRGFPIRRFRFFLIVFYSKAEGCAVFMDYHLVWGVSFSRAAQPMWCISLVFGGRWIGGRRLPIRYAPSFPWRQRFLLWPLLPKILAIPSPETIETGKWRTAKGESGFGTYAE